METHYQDDNRPAQDSLAPLSEDLQKCALRLKGDIFYNFIKTTTEIWTDAQQHLKSFSNNRLAKRIEVHLLHTLIVNNGRMTPAEISRQLMCPKYAVTRILNSLEERGLIKREPCGYDLRTVDVVITRRGIDTINKRIDYVQRNIFPKVLGNLSEKELSDFQALLQKIETYLIARTRKAKRPASAESLPDRHYKD